jgi:D-xylose transport system substrate-binding protein
MLKFQLKGLQLFLLAAAILFSFSVLQSQDKRASSGTLKIGFLMDSLKVERWQTDLDKFQKRAAELGAEVLVETAEGDDELQLQQARKLLTSGVKALVLVPHDADKAVTSLSLLESMLRRLATCKHFRSLSKPRKETTC